MVPNLKSSGGDSRRNAPHPASGERDRVRGLAAERYMRASGLWPGGHRSDHMCGDMGGGGGCANRPESHTNLGGEMDYASCRSLPAMFFEVAMQRASRPFLWA